jgi:hypothetical protein
MLDQLMNLVRQHSNEAIVNNPAIPNQQNEQAVSQAGNSILGGLQQALSQGRINEVLELFKGGTGNMASKPVVQEISGNYAQQLQGSVGLDPAQANQVAGNVVPNVLQQFINKTNDPSDNSFNIQDIFNQLSGGKTAGFNVQSLINKFGAGKFDKDGDGDVDLQDLKNMFMGGGASDGGAGGLMDKVKGMF